MKRRWIVLAAVGILAATLAYFLRDLINDRVVVPLAYLWWRIGLYYQSIEEDTWLRLAVVVISLIAYASIIGDQQFLREGDAGENKSAQGPVEALVIALKKSPRRTYYRWLVANQLARLARSFLMQDDGRRVQRWDGSLKSPGWDPPEDVKAYLKYGLRHPFASPRPKSHDPLGAIEYLESKIGDRNDAD
ncbi:MAG: hypothetical protein AB1649_33515 [Chloroflexota bacterium]